jgi:hypothetical protein
MTEVRLFPAPARPDSSSSHDLRVHIDDARSRRACRVFLEEVAVLCTRDPVRAALLLQLLLELMRDLGS